MNNSLPHIGNISPINEKEIVGRAIDRKEREYIYQGTKAIKISWEDFYDTRPDSNLSVDRLGINKINSSIINIIKPIAEKRATKRSLSFIGWATLNIKELAKAHTVTTMPIHTIQDKNLYHAEIIKNNPNNEKKRNNEFAYSIFGIFNSCGSMLELINHDKKPSPFELMAAIFYNICYRIKSLFS